MFKKSIYNILIKESHGKTLIFNTYSTALGVLNLDLKDLYNNIESEYDKNNKDIIFLKENGFIVDHNIDEFKRLCVEERVNRFDDSILNLTIAPTMSCNMICSYCYEAKSNQFMNNNVIHKLITFINKKIIKNNLKEINLVWYGGEPLLCIELLKKISCKIILLCNKYNIKYSSSIVTNGVLLDVNTAKILKHQCKINHVQITIDGLRIMHNKRRRLKNNEDSFNIIIKNINDINDILNIIIRVNIDKKNIMEMHKLIDYLIDYTNLGNKVKINFHPIVVKNTDFCNVEEKHCINAKEFDNIEATLINKLYNKGAIDSIYKLDPMHNSVFCTAVCNNSFVIDPEGFLYACWDFIGIKEKRIGSIFDDEISINSERCKWLLLDIPQQCSTCNLVPMCKGGCPSARLYNNKPCCDPRVMSLKEKLHISYDNFKNTLSSSYNE
ncbi:radical SAM protein [Clostridium sp. Marseille-Q2269]|uniref:radical SAM/SPASM domain-containing protein n=1 Tax=Clostridium sp. Marseille-Q2269 TaxID=2942205 RepID=UPI002073D727|nr:radical SAM protein [Clostridium sp. Marseille-Q2269]